MVSSKTSQQPERRGTGQTTFMIKDLQTSYILYLCTSTVRQSITSLGGDINAKIFINIIYYTYARLKCESPSHPKEEAVSYSPRDSPTCQSSVQRSRDPPMSYLKNEKAHTSTDVRRSTGVDYIRRWTAADLKPRDILKRLEMGRGGVTILCE